MIDHHVDRPGVEARQRAKLTGPNRPNGSTSLLASRASGRQAPPCAAVIHTGWPPKATWQPPLTSQVFYPCARRAALWRAARRTGTAARAAVLREILAMRILARTGARRRAVRPGLTRAAACRWAGRPGGLGGSPHPIPSRTRP